MKTEENKDIHDLKLHETTYVERELEDPLVTTVMRVDGGWIYRCFDKGSGIMGCTFVSYTGEFV